MSILNMSLSFLGKDRHATNTYSNLQQVSISVETLKYESHVGSITFLLPEIGGFSWQIDVTRTRYGRFEIQQLSVTSR